VGGKHDLFLGTKTIGEATAVNSNGTQIVGQSLDASGTEVAFFYSDKRGLIALGTLSHAAGDQSIANGISDNGRVVGWSGNPFGGGIEAFTWTSHDGMKRLATVLRKLGAKVPAGTILTTAVSISADGSTLVGQYVHGQNFGNWMAQVTK
jgi:probable HAF family extracellular repeat protein